MKRKLFWTAVLWLAVLLLMSLAGCRGVKYVPVETVRTDSIYLNKLQRDSIVKYDSIYVRDKGDTVWLEKYRYVYRDRVVRDTVYVGRTDSVQVPYPVERELTRWQRFRMGMGDAMLCLLAFGVLGLAGYWLKKRIFGA